MADLSEYLGHILCEITRARVMADAEAVRIAREYAADASGLLRHFPVPRMRLPQVEMTVPVVVSKIPEGYVETTTVDPPLLGKLLADELGPALEKEGIHINTAEIARIIKADPMLSKGLLGPDLAEKLSAKIEDHTRVYKKTRTRSTSRRVAAESASTAERFQQISAIIREQLDKSLGALPRRPAGIDIDAKTASVKEVGNPAVVVNVKLIIKEESLEMLLEEAPSGQPGTRITRLVPE